jgi:superfamily I DNA and/or RNA helicase
MHRDIRAFSSEVDTGSREENASKQKMRAFSSEVDTGSREENASDQKISARF